MDPLIERAIAERARSQLGLITRDQLTEAGMSRATRSRRVGRGLLPPVGAGTYRLPGTPDHPRLEVLAACLDLGAVASHRSAAWLHGLFERPRRVEVTVPKGRSTRTASTARQVIHTSTNLPDDDVVLVGPVPTTSVARTLMGLAALPDTEVPDEALVGAVEEAVRTRQASDRWLWWLLEQRRCRGRDGVRRFEGVLARRAALGPTESWLERELLRLLDEAGLPRPALQRVVRRRGAFVARVDFLYEAERIVIEVLGHTHHSARPQLSADSARASAITLAGYDVHQLTYDQIVQDPDWVVSVVRRALAAAWARTAHPLDPDAA